MVGQRDQVHAQRSCQVGLGEPGLVPYLPQVFPDGYAPNRARAGVHGPARGPSVVRQSVNSRFDDEVAQLAARFI